MLLERNQCILTLENNAPTGAVVISGLATQGTMLTANTSALADADGLGTLIYQWKADGTNITGATASTYTLTQDEVGKTITVAVSYTDGEGTSESVLSSATTSVTNVNDDPTGNVAITGTATQGGTLTADTSALDDADGLGTLSYQWKADGSDISGATSSTYTLTQAEVGKAITVAVSYTDGEGTSESVLSAASAAVTNTNDPVSGAVSITGTATQGQVLTADASGLSDSDGVGAFSYVWKADGTTISGATGSTYTLTQAEVGKTITVTASYTDGGGTVESVQSSATSAVANVNDAPTGTVTISGTVTQGETLTADTTSLADADGLGALSFQWLRDGVEITGATGATYDLVQADVGTAINVDVSYIDGFGASEIIRGDVSHFEVVLISSSSIGDVSNGLPFGLTYDELVVIGSDTNLEFLQGGELSLWSVDTDGNTSLIASGLADGLDPGVFSPWRQPGAYDPSLDKVGDYYVVVFDAGGAYLNIVNSITGDATGPVMFSDGSGSWEINPVVFSLSDHEFLVGWDDRAGLPGSIAPNEFFISKWDIDGSEIVSSIPLDPVFDEYSQFPDFFIVSEEVYGVVWTNAGQNGASSDVYAQLFSTATLQSVSDRIQVTVNGTAPDVTPSVASLPDGNFAFLWTRGPDGETGHGDFSSNELVISENGGEKVDHGSGGMILLRAA